MGHGFTYDPPYILTRGLPSPRLGYLPVSPHRLPTTGSGHALTTCPSEEKQPARALSITGSGMDVPAPVREYQPVVHRLRLSASP